jgi:hypothetical protein
LILKNQIEIVINIVFHIVRQNWTHYLKIINSFEMNLNLDDSAHVQLDNIDIRQLIDLVEKTICCLGQTNVTINYQRRTSALVKVTRDPSKAKSMLRDKHGILAKSVFTFTLIYLNPVVYPEEPLCSLPPPFLGPCPWTEGLC